MVEDTRLVGTTFPNGVIYPSREAPYVDHGWNAVLLVEGDPRTVMAAYRRQAAAAGIAFVSRGNRSTMCELESETDLYTCEAFGSSLDRSRSMQIDVVRGRPGYGPVSHAVLHYSDRNLPGEGTSSAVPEPTVPRGPKPPPVPHKWPARAAIGHLMIPGYLGPVSLIVEAGSAVVAPVAPESVTTGHFAWRVVLRISGSPQGVAEAYLRQLEGLHTVGGYVSPEVAVSTDDAGRTVYRISGETLGGDSHSISIVDGPRGEWMILSASTD